MLYFHKFSRPQGPRMLYFHRVRSPWGWRSLRRTRLLGLRVKGSFSKANQRSRMRAAGECLLRAIALRRCGVRRMGRLAERSARRHGLRSLQRPWLAV